MPRLSIEALSAISLRDGDRPILRRVSLAVGTGRSARLVGESGAGKVDHRQGDSRNHSVAGEDHGGRIDLRAAIFCRCRRMNCAIARPRHRAHSAGSLDGAQPGAADRRADDRRVAPEARPFGESARRARALLEEVQIRDPERVLKAIRTSFPAACASAC
jgi:peptide/nickel transport system ATP-binding protein